MGIAQVGREKVLPPLWPGCPLVCLTEPDDGIRSDRQSGASGIVKPLFCARAMRGKGAREGGPCPRSVPTWRAHGVRPANPGAGQICTFQKWKCVGGNSSTRRMAHDIFGGMSQEHTGDAFLPLRVPIRTSPNISRHATVGAPRKMDRPV